MTLDKKTQQLRKQIYVLKKELKAYKTTEAKSKKKLRFTILDGSASGTVVYQETQTATTNSLGLFVVNIGQGTPVTGNFSTINWGGGNKFTQVELDVAGGTSFTNMGTSQMLSVPYSLYSAHSGDAVQKATYRYATFHTYDQYNWIGNNDATFFGGITPSSWTDASALASQMSADKEVLRTLFQKKGYAGANAMIISDVFSEYSSTDGEVCVVLFRITNNSGSAITWTPTFYYSAYSGWGEMASISVNGANTWSSGTTGTATVPLSIPAGGVTSVIFVSTGTSPVSTGSNSVRSNRLLFYNNSLTLPAGLQFVDDLDTATGGWGQ